MNSKSSDLCEGPIVKRVIFYTLPIILTGVLQLLFNSADLVVVGRYCGSISVGAVGNTAPVINLLVNFFIGFSVGAGVTVAHAIGSGRSDDVHKTVHTAIPTAIASGLVLTVIGIVFSRDILLLMGTPKDVINHSDSYMKIYFCGVTSNMLYNFGASIMRASGDTRTPLVYLTVAGVINVIFNLIFVILFDMNVSGVALATVISQTVSAVLILRSLMKRNDDCKLVLKEMRFHKRQLIRIIKIGFPAGLQSSLFSISNIIIQSSVNSFGAVVMSGNASAQNIEGFIYTSMNSYQQTAMNFIGQNFGARKFDRIKKISIVCLVSVFVTGIVFSGLVYSFGRQLLSIYITDSQQAINYGLIRMTYIVVPYFMCGLMDVSTGLIRGIGYSLLPMIITVVGVCGFRILWIYKIFIKIPKFHTLESLYVSYIISWTVVFIIEIGVFIFLFRKLQKKKVLA